MSLLGGRPDWPDIVVVVGVALVVAAGLSAVAVTFTQHGGSRAGRRVFAVNGVAGVVEAINLRTVILRDVEGVVHAPSSCGGGRGVAWPRALG